MFNQTTYSWSYPLPCNPKAYISINHNRIKVYKDDKIYLNDGTEFEIELHNDSNYNVKAEFAFNGKLQSHSLVLRPYQRFYLDRFMDEDKKLKFNTFTTGNDDIEELKKILEKNGKIEIRFYREVVEQHYTTWNYIYLQDNSSSNDSYDSNFLGFSDVSNTTGGGAAKKLYSSTNMRVSAAKTQSNTEIETGRVEKGEKSNQSFIPTTMKFETWSVASFEYQILPTSQIPKEKREPEKQYIVADDKMFRVYCQECGRKVKKGWNFCPGCGEKY